MLQALTQNWWMLALRGFVAILFGVCAFVWPHVVALAFVFLLAAFAFVEGILSLISAFGWGLPGGQRFLMILIGVLGLAVGVAAVRYPGITAIAIVLFVAWWAIVSGIVQLVVAVEMRKVISNDWMLVLGGILSIVFGLLLIWRPLAGVITLAWIFGFYAFLFGFTMVGLAFRIRSLTAPRA